MNPPSAPPYVGLAPVKCRQFHQSWTSQEPAHVSRGLARQSAPIISCRKTARNFMPVTRLRCARRKRVTGIIFTDELDMTDSVLSSRSGV